MFILNINLSKKQSINYPKYLICSKNENSTYLWEKHTFYYLISPNKPYSCIPTYLIMPYLYFNVRGLSGLDLLFNLSKLGTDYIVNYLCIHYKDECTGSYPDNYVFVNEPDWPYEEIDKTDRRPLKRSY